MKAEYLPHQHVTKWNTYHHKLSWDFIYLATTTLEDVGITCQAELRILMKLLDQADEAARSS